MMALCFFVETKKLSTNPLNALLLQYIGGVVRVLLWV
jgi:hypothetical protein